MYNKYLALKIDKYKESKESFTYNQCANDMKSLKVELEWLKEVDSTALQSSLKDLDLAYQKFLRNILDFQNSNQKKITINLISQNIQIIIFNT